MLIIPFQAPEDIPIHPEYNLPNAEDAEFAIEWPRFREAVAQFKADASSGETPNSDGTEPESDLDSDKPASVCRLWRMLG